MNTNGLTSNPPVRNVARHATIGAVMLAVAMAAVLFAPKDPAPPGPQATTTAPAQRPDTAPEPRAARSDPVTFGQQLGALAQAPGEELLARVRRGLGAEAPWPDKILAAEVFALCTGHVHQSRPGANAGTDARALRCAALSALTREEFYRGQAQLERELAGPGSPLAPMLLRTEDGSRPPPADIAAARAHMRQAFELYGPAALHWFRAPLQKLAVLDGAPDERLELFRATSPEIVAVAFDIARCMAAACDLGSGRTELACDDARRCSNDAVEALLARHAKPGDREMLRQWARDLVAAIESGHWRQLGLAGP